MADGITTMPRLASESDLAAAPEAWATVSGMSFGPWHAPARKTPSVAVQRAQLGVLLQKEAVRALADAEDAGDVGGVVPRLHGRAQHDHIDRDA